MKSKMQKSSKPRQVKTNPGGREGGYSHGVPTKFVERDLCGTDPLKQQFEPTDAEPARQHYKMAGGC